MSNVIKFFWKVWLRLNLLTNVAEVSTTRSNFLKAGAMAIILCAAVVTSCDKDKGEDVKTPIAVTGVTLSKTTLSLVAGSTETLTATVAPTDAANKTVMWVSDKTAVATVADGLVTAVSAGTAIITVTTTDGSKTATCTVTVTPAPVSVESVALNKTELPLKVGEEETLTATVTPTGATNPAITWSSNDEAVATVVDGLVTAVDAGTATITVTTTDGGKTATCIVTVTAEPSLEVDTTSISAAAATGTYTIEVTSNVPWTATVNDEATAQCSVNPASGTGNGTITVTVNANTGTAVLTATVTVTGGELSRQITISQFIDAKITMVAVGGGTFTKIGCSDAVTLSGFSIGIYEVTQTQWMSIMGSENNPSEFIGWDDRPVERVSWDDVQDFISKLNTVTGKSYRLPTEAEWEFAASGGNLTHGYTYSGSNTASEVAQGAGLYATMGVGLKAPNELGIYDMSGNVFEYCSDWFEENYCPPTSQDPTGPESGTQYVVRGGGFGNDDCAISRRNKYAHDAFRNYVGFRLVLP
jgi:formylglycine-generating enzyme required for sulfatase activity